MYKGINDFKKGYRPRAYVIKIYEAILQKLQQIYEVNGKSAIVIY